MRLAEKWNWQWVWMTMYIIWIQTNKVNMNKMDCGRWNEWDGLWTEGNKNETWSMRCGLKEKRWNMKNEVWTNRNEMKHNNEADNVTISTLILQSSEKQNDIITYRN